MQEIKENWENDHENRKEIHKERIFDRREIDEIEIPKYKSSDINLYNQIVKMDATYFTAYNKCDLKTQSDILSNDIEFFHDKGGLSTSKKL